MTDQQGDLGLGTTVVNRDPRIVVHVGPTWGEPMHILYITILG